MFHYLPNEFIYSEKLPENTHSLLKSTFLSALLDLSRTGNLKKPEGWRCEVKSTFGEDNSFLQTSFIYDNVVWGPLDRMLTNQDYPFTFKPRSSQVSDIWLNMYEPGSYQEMHSHGNATFSGIYLVDLKEPNKTVFQSSLSNVGSKTMQSMSTEFLEEGSIILFPSYLAHYVLPTQKHRVTLSFNVHSSYD